MTSAFKKRIYKVDFSKIFDLIFCELLIFAESLLATLKTDMARQTAIKLRVSWRDTWYSVVVWILAIAISGLVMMPWYFLVLPLVVFWATAVYFGKSEKTLNVGLWCSLVWFFAAAFLDFLEIIGPYYGNAFLYFSDARNFIKYPLILLVPVIYSLILETKIAKKKKAVAGFASTTKTVVT